MEGGDELSAVVELALVAVDREADLRDVVLHTERAVRVLRVVSLFRGSSKVGYVKFDYAERAILQTRKVSADGTRPPEGPILRTLVKCW